MNIGYLSERLAQSFPIGFRIANIFRNYCLRRRFDQLTDLTFELQEVLAACTDSIEKTVEAIEERRMFMRDAKATATKYETMRDTLCEHVKTVGDDEELINLQEDITLVEGRLAQTANKVILLNKQTEDLKGIKSRYDNFKGKLELSYQRTVRLVYSSGFFTKLQN